MTHAELLEFMRACPLVTVATVGANGEPQSALVVVAVSERLEIVFDTLDTTRKFRNVQRVSRVAVTFGAAGPYCLGQHDERTLQYEGIAHALAGEDLRWAQEEIYFRQFPEGRPRLSWPRIAYVRVQPVWIRFTNYNVSPPEIVELSGQELTGFIADQVRN